MGLIYHYTSIDVLHNILTNYRKEGSNDFIELWASSIYLLNDPLEMLKAPDIILSVLLDLEKTLNIEDSLKVSSAFEKDIDSIKECFRKLLKRDKYLFIISLSNNKDTLPMWSMYTNNGKGVCLCFDKGILVDYFKQNQDLQTELNPVSYDFNNLELSTIDKLKALYQEYISEMADDCIVDKESVIDGFRYNFMRVLAPLYKDSVYRYEGEERIICTQQRHDDTIDFRVSSNGYIIPYRRIKIPAHSLKSVIIGPSYNYDLIEDGLRQEIILSDVKIDLEKSKVNYRSI